MDAEAERFAQFAGLRERALRGSSKPDPGGCRSEKGCAQRKENYLLKGMRHITQNH